MYRELVNYATQTYPFLIKHTDVRYIPHFHEETEIVYVTEGELEFTLGTKSYLIKKGDICIIPSGHIHNLYTYSHSKSFVMKLYPIIDLSGMQLKNYIISQSFHFYDQIVEYITEIISENDSKTQGFELAVNINAEKLFLFILRKMEYVILDKKIKSKRSSENDFLSEVNSFIEDNLNSDISLDDIARLFNYTKSYFCRYFKKITGNTFWEYYTMFRLEKSVELIRSNSKENFTGIAVKSGFKNVRSFNQAFKEYYRCTPSEYRKMLK